jgi:hypothetical protein
MEVFLAIEIPFGAVDLPSRGPDPVNDKTFQVPRQAGNS